MQVLVVYSGSKDSYNSLTGHSVLEKQCGLLGIFKLLCNVFFFKVPNFSESNFSATFFMKKSQKEGNGFVAIIMKVRKRNENKVCRIYTHLFF